MFGESVWTNEALARIYAANPSMTSIGVSCWRATGKKVLVNARGKKKPEIVLCNSFMLPTYAGEVELEIEAIRRGWRYIGREWKCPACAAKAALDRLAKAAHKNKPEKLAVTPKHTPAVLREKPKQGTGYTHPQAAAQQRQRWQKQRVRHG